MSGSLTFPADPVAAMQLVAGNARQIAGGVRPTRQAERLTLPPESSGTAVWTATSRLLELQHAHNESGLAPLPWNLVLVAHHPFSRH